MELPQQQRPFGTEGRKPTHDFLSLYTHSTLQPDPRPTSQGNYLKTHDFLQPLERAGKASAKEETNGGISVVEKPPPPAALPPSVEHILPGGIGTYSISHAPYFNQRVPKPEGTIFTVAQAISTDKNDENSNCSSYTGSGFTLWEESALKKGKTRKENGGETHNIVREEAIKAGQWATSERASQSSSSNQRDSFSSLSSFQPSGQKKQSFIEMIQSAKCSTKDDDLGDEEEFVLKKETTSPIHQGELRIKVDGKTITDHKANTPRSKHSATEQRRRSKINDRFQRLRELIPHGDQKRDKASFLLEVIEYIQFLQEKVQKYEGSHQGWNQQPTKLMPLRNNNRPAESFVDQSQGINSAAATAMLFAANFDKKNIAVSQAIPGTAQNRAESDMNSVPTFKGMDHHSGLSSKAMAFPMSLQPSFFNPGQTGGAVAQIPPRLSSDAEHTATQPQLYNNRSCTTDGAVTSDRLKEQGLAIEGGAINISTAYSQGLLNTLTQALQSSGVDLSQAKIAVQIELGRRANGRPIAPMAIVKGDEVPTSTQGITRSRTSSAGQSDKALKKVKTSKN